MQTTARARHLLPLLVAGALAACNASADQTPAAGAVGEGVDRGGRVDGREARALVADGATLVDVRTRGEFAGGHIDGALNIPVQSLPEAASRVSKDRPVVVYCRSGRRSALAADMLRERGWEVHDLGPQTAW